MGILAVPYSQGRLDGSHIRDCISYWPLNKPAGSRAIDVRGRYNNEGTLIANTHYENDYVVFDGINDYINCGNDASLQISNGTAGCWVRAPSPGDGYRGVLVKEGAYGIFLVSGYFGIYSWGDGNFKSTGINIADGKWHFVAFTFASGVSSGTTVYLDGVAVLTTFMQVSDQSDFLAFGYNGPYQAMAGDIKNAFVSSAILTPGEILNLYEDPYGLNAANDYLFIPAAGGGDVSTELTGLSSTGSVGTLSVTAQQQVDVALTGLSATGQIGTVTVSTGTDTEIIITGVNASGQVGSVSISTEAIVGVTGAQATGQVGTLTAEGFAPDVEVALSGLSANAQLGTLTVSIVDPDVTVAITGVAMTGSVGALSIQLDGGWTDVTPSSATWTPITASSSTWSDA